MRDARSVLFWRNRWWPVLLAGLLQMATPAPAMGREGLRIGGFVKSLDLYQQKAPAGLAEGGRISSNRLRLDLSDSPSKTLKWAIALENRLIYTSPADLFPLSASRLNRRLGLQWNWRRRHKLADALTVDRLNLRWSSPALEATVGRQAIGFGRIALFSPLDVIAPFPPDALDTDVRPGVDALRAVHYFGLGGQVGGVAVFGDQPRHNSYLGTFSWNAGGVDLLLLGGSLRQRPMAGVGLAGSLGGWGAKGELSAYQGQHVGSPGGDLQKYFAISALEGWYRFANGLVLLSEYLYNGVGTAAPAQYPAVAASAPLTEGLSFLLGRHYLLLAPSFELHPLVKLEGLLIWNLLDGSFFLRPLIDLSLSDNLSLQLFWGIAAGKKPQYLTGPPRLETRSEFGAVGSGGCCFLKYFF